MDVSCHGRSGLSGVRAAGRCRRTAVWLGVMSLLAGAGGGCTIPKGTEKALPVHSTQQFDTQVLRCDMPALVLFYKQGCPPCLPLHGTVDELANEYKGRAIIAQVMVWNFVFQSPVPELIARYNIRWVPLVILFVNRQPCRRWGPEYDINVYRSALNQALATKPSQGQ